MGTVNFHVTIPIEQCQTEKFPFTSQLFGVTIITSLYFRVRLPDHLHMMAKDFAEHYHDSWAMIKIDNGWTCGPSFEEDTKKHPNLKQFNKLHERVQFQLVFLIVLKKII